MGLEDREGAMEQLQMCRIETFPAPQEGEIQVKTVVDPSLIFWEVQSGKLNGEVVVHHMDNAFFDKTVQDVHAKMCTITSNFHLPYVIEYHTDSGKAPMKKIRRKAVLVLPRTVKSKMDDPTRPVISAEEIAESMRMTEDNVMDYLFEHEMQEGIRPPLPNETEAILHQVSTRCLLPAKTIDGLRSSFSMTTLCAALNHDFVPTAKKPTQDRAPQPWKSILQDTNFRRNQIGRCNERLYGAIMASAMPHAVLVGMFHEVVSNDDGSRRVMRKEEIGEADYSMSNATIAENTIILLVTSDSDQIIYFLLRHAHLKNTVIWFENQKEGRFYNLSLLRAMPNAREIFLQRALSYVLAGTDFVHAEVIGSSLKIQTSMQQMPNFSLSSVWSDDASLIAAIDRVMLANFSKRKKQLTDAKGELIPFSTARDVANNLFYKSGELFRLFMVSHT